MQIATQRDMDTIMEIVAGTVAIMKAEGSGQWSDDYPLAHDFKGDIEAGTLFLLREDNRALGFICLNRIEPKEYAELVWGSDEPCLVIHRLAVHPDARKQGVGGKLMRFAEEQTLETGLAYIKSDTYSINQNMNRLFLKHGYIKTGEVNLKGRPLPYNCYEKKL